MLSRPILAIAAIVATVASCGSSEVRSNAEQFCGEAAERRDNIISPPLSTEAELAATLDFYRLMGQLAPLSISEQWNDLVLNLETASTIVVGDASSEQRVALQAYATERSAYEVSVWLERNCGVDLGQITTIAPQAPVPVPIVAATTPATTPG